MVKVTCLGGAGSVTGSSYLVESSSSKKLLVDCGLFQGGRKMEERNWMDWGFDPALVKALFLTHAHIDHSGRIPKLVKDGFRGRIITSPPTAELAEILLLDSAHIQEMDAEWQTRKNRRQGGREIVPLYTVPDAQASLSFFSPLDRDKVFEVEPGIRARLRNAGHILGSSILELWMEEPEGTIKIVFSGDLGKKDQLIVRDPHSIFDADYLFVESTYGNRLHRSFEESRTELLEAIRYSVSHGQKILIPAFAVERSQEILYVLGEFHRDGSLPDIPVYLDSPLAIKATKIFRKNHKYYDDDAMAIVSQGFDPFDLPNLRLTETTQDSIAINQTEGPAVVIAGNGMCTAGRIKHHLKHNLWRPGAALVIVGFQAQGTTGRKIVDGEKWVKVFGERVAVRAKVFTIGGFSAHADQKDLLDWVGCFESRPRVFVVHGEAVAAESLAGEIEQRLKLDVHVPRWKERLILKPKETVYEKPAEAEPEFDPEQSMLNALIDMENEIEMLKRRIKQRKGGETPEDDLDRLRYIREEIQEILANRSK